MGIVVRDIVQMATAQLERCGVENAKVDAELIFRHLLKVDKMGFFKLWGTALDDATWDRYLDLITQRSQGLPLQHITGEQEFMGLTFAVTPEVLIPRQETEVLVGEVVRIIQSGNKKSYSVLDLCSGSGVIGISIVSLCKNVKVTASDVSEKAIEMTRKNAKALGVDKRMSFVKGDLFQPFKGRFKTEKFDIIVSNPPYIRSGDIAGLQVEVKDHEPLLALDGGADGLEFYRKIINDSHAHFKKDGVLALEIGHDQALDVAKIAGETERFDGIELIKDLAGKDRVLIFSY